MKLSNWLRRGVLVAAALLATTAAYAAPPAGWTQVALEKGKFTLQSSTSVAYGAGNSYVTRTLASGTRICNTTTFLSDPAPGVKKACYANLAIPSGAAPALGTVLSTDDTFTVPTSTIVTYGVGSQVVTRTLAAGKYRCGTELFVTDPAPGAKKSCVSGGAGGTPTPPTGPGPYLATQGGTFILNGSRVVSFGVNGTYVQATLTTGTKTCAASSFPSDPAPSLTKYCYDMGAPGVVTPTPPTGPGTYLATENGSFTLTATKIVAYGIGGTTGVTYAEATLNAGTYSCANATFPSDPMPGTTKYCYDKGAPTTGGTTPTPVAHTMYSLGGQSAVFTLTGSTLTSYGSSTLRNDKQLPAGTYTCADQEFGDPHSGANKACQSISQYPETKVANVGANFTLTSSTTVVFGGKGFYNKVTLPAGTYACSTVIFGDASPGKNSGCYVPNTTTPGAGVQIPTGPGSYLATQGGTYTLSGSRVVAYGVSTSNYVQATLTAGAKTCQTSDFPNDPSPGNTKYCYDLGAPVVTTAPGGPGAFAANQGDAFTVSGSKVVAYGFNGKYVEKTLTGAQTCSTATFGSDPDSTNAKFCYVTEKPTAPTGLVAATKVLRLHRVQGQNRLPVDLPPSEKGPPGDFPVLRSIQNGRR